MSILSNFNSKNKILIVISIILAIVTAITVTIATFAIKNKRTLETMEAQSIEEIKKVSVADVLESNIQFDYDTNPTEEAIELKIKDYDSSFNLYYCIQEIGQESEEESFSSLKKFSTVKLEFRHRQILRFVLNEQGMFQVSKLQ